MNSKDHEKENGRKFSDTTEMNIISQTKTQRQPVRTMRTTKLVQSTLLFSQYRRLKKLSEGAL